SSRASPPPARPPPRLLRSGQLFLVTRAAMCAESAWNSGPAREGRSAMMRNRIPKPIVQGSLCILLLFVGVSSAHASGATLGVHSNVEPGDAQTSGHAWISLKEGATTTTYGKWPDCHPLVKQQGLDN